MIDEENAKITRLEKLINQYKNTNKNISNQNNTYISSHSYISSSNNGHSSNGSGSSTRRSLNLKTTNTNDDDAYPRTSHIDSGTRTNLKTTSSNVSSKSKRSINTATTRDTIRSGM